VSFDVSASAGSLRPFQCQIDLLLSDLGLPDATGYELMSQIRARHSIPGIALSGFGMEEDVRKCHEAWFKEHLVKPVRITQLEEALARIVPRHSL
jgi:CheY-like chemotaxis protein